MKVLVTGGSGYIGSFIVRHLLRHSAIEVVVLDILKHFPRDQSDTRLSEWKRKVEYPSKKRTLSGFYVGDCCKEEVLNEIFKAHAIDAVVHCAAALATSEEIDDISFYYKTNVGGTAKVLQVMKSHGCSQMVFASSGMTRKCLKEGGDTCSHLYAYAHSKLRCEQIIPKVCQEYDLSVMTLRFYNVAGGCFQGEIGEVRRPENHLIPRALRIALAAKIGCCGRSTDPAKYLTVFGTEYPTHDGTCVRDYVHVEDVAQAVSSSLQFLSRKASTDSGSYNAVDIGSGHGTSVIEVLEECKRVTGHSLPVKFAPPRPGDVATMVADVSDAFRIMGWKPQQTFKDVVTSAWLFHSRFPDTLLY